MRIANIIAKANAHYTCQECGSTEMLQAHHRIPKDDSTLICLCAECHSKKHPNVPRNLFLVKKIQQPYWENKSASSLAKELGVNSRTVCRIARRLNINSGILDQEKESLIRMATKRRNPIHVTLCKTVNIDKSVWLELKEFASRERITLQFAMSKVLSYYIKAQKLKLEE